MRLLARFFDKLPWTPLVLVALLLGLAPFKPEPHLLEKLRMLAQGRLTEPIDIFDLFMHGFPLVLLAAKMLFKLRA